MSTLKDMVEKDNRSVFMNMDEFAEPRTVVYDGISYDDIPIVLSELKEENRPQLMSDHVEGLYLVSAEFFCDIKDLGGVQPENGTYITIADTPYDRRYKVVTSSCEMGMLHVGLEAVDE